MSLRTEMLLDRLEIERDLGTQTFRWHDHDLPCVPSSLSADSILIIGGEQINIGLTLIVRKNVFITTDSEDWSTDSEEVLTETDIPYPVSGDILHFRSVPYKVAVVKMLGALDALEISCTDDQR